MDLLPGALALALVGFAQSIAIVKSYAVEHDRTVDAKQEMLAYGAANLGSGILQGFAVTGSLSKSAAAQEARARSQVAPLVSAVMVVLTILFLAGLFRDLPEAVLAAVVIEAVSGMLRVGKVTTLRRGRTPEFFAALGALLGVLLIGIFAGVVIGVVLSFALFIHTVDHPHIARIQPLARRGPLRRSRGARGVRTCGPGARRARARTAAGPAARSAPRRAPASSARAAGRGRRYRPACGPRCRCGRTSAQRLAFLVTCAASHASTPAIRSTATATSALVRCSAGRRVMASGG